MNMTPEEKLEEAIKRSYEKNNGQSSINDSVKWHIHEQAFLDGMQYALKMIEEEI